MRILIADDHGIVRSGLKLLLESQPDMEVVAEASDGVEAVELALREQPDLCILDAAEGPREPLSPREQEVVKLIAEAHTNTQIAEILHLAEKTVESHRANVLRKLGMRDRVELVRYAIRRGLVEP
jgi:DNA-binding NarL/FixJ family response regulator